MLLQLGGQLVGRLVALSEAIFFRDLVVDGGEFWASIRTHLHKMCPVAPEALNGEIHTKTDVEEEAVHQPARQVIQGQPLQILVVSFNMCQSP